MEKNKKIKEKEGRGKGVRRRIRKTAKNGKIKTN